MFSLVDVILILIVGAFVCFGLFFGLVHTLGSLVGTILGIIISTRISEPVFHTFGFLVGNTAVGKIIMFVAIFFLVSRLIGIAFWILEKVFGMFSWIPFAGVVNRVLGALFGLIEGVIFVGVVIFFAMQYAPDSVIQQTLADSSVASLLLALVAAFQVLFPEAAKTMTQTTP